MKAIVMPSKEREKKINELMGKGLSSIAAVTLVELREIELNRREIVDGCPFSKNGRQTAEAKFRKYLESQMME